MLHTLLTLGFIAFHLVLAAQPVPADEENIPHLVTFGNNGSPSWGDDDFTQTFFFVVPENHVSPIYIRVYDPDVGGKLDEIKSTPNTKTTFSVYGGKSCITHEDARQTDPTGNFKSGTLLASKTFGKDTLYDQSWYTFGPFNPREGELAKKYGGRVFKVIAQGVSGNDGNLYNYFMSSSPKKNVAIEGGNAFTYEYSFRLHSKPGEVSHIYPYVDNNVVSVKQSNFDWDNDGIMRIVSVSKKGEFMKSSDDQEWAYSEHTIVEAEKGTSLDIQFIKKPGSKAIRNNVVFYVTNQYGELLPFYTVPIGGIPKYQYQIKRRDSSKN